MYAADIKIGQTVTTPRIPGRTWTVLDRHPLAGHWWLADQETGHVSVDWYEDGSWLTLVDDPYRPGTVIHTTHGTKRVRAQSQDWVVTSADTGNTYFLVHRHSGVPFGYRFRTLGKAKSAMIAAQEADVNSSAPELNLEDIAHLAEITGEFA